MTTRSYIVESDSYNPYKNLALEEYLLQKADSSTGILYLWQNKATVVIGRNQHSFKECNLEKLSAAGGFLARRLSGGGAVYHDLGNLNFTFVMHNENYDVKKQMDVILKAVKMLGINAEASGRNDISLNGKKFSGNAFYRGRQCSYHHGTILLRVNMQLLSEYLNVDPQKLKSKGVDSVKSRVVNLCEYSPDITVDIMKDCMTRAFAQTYRTEPERPEIDEKDFAELIQKYASDEWKYGYELNSNYSLSERFSWGGIELAFKLENGIIDKCAVYSDAMEVDFTAGLPEKLKGVHFDKQAMTKALISTGMDKKYAHITEDICTLF